MSIINAALNQNIRQAQAKAEIMMDRRDPYNNSMTKEIHQDWFFTGVVDTLTPLTLPSSATSRLSSKYLSADQQLSLGSSELKQSESEVGRSETMSALKGRLPYYLTDSGSVHSASLEVNDKLVCCVPGERSKSMQERRVYNPKQLSTGTSSVAISGSYTTDDDTNWQPLSTDALLEHTKVTAIPIKGMGDLAHGHYSMWRP
jgi:hypothetical protein